MADTALLADASADSKGGNTLLKLLVLAIFGIILANVGRKVAISKSDKEFEERLRLADERRNGADCPRPSRRS